MKGVATWRRHPQKRSRLIQGQEGRYEREVNCRLVEETDSMEVHGIEAKAATRLSTRVTRTQTPRNTQQKAQQARDSNTESTLSSRSRHSASLPKSAAKKQIVKHIVTNSAAKGQSATTLWMKVVVTHGACSNRSSVERIDHRRYKPKHIQTMGLLSCI